MASRDISEEIIEDLYAEALVLADDARAVFDLRFGAHCDSSNDLLRVALSIEGLRTTTRVMHVLAWLLNQRAYFSGELSEGQLRRNNALPDERRADPANLAMLEPETRELIHDSERLHARVARLDQEWRQRRRSSDTPVQALQGRIAQAFSQVD
jgi:regulator of CtrA degradation